MDYEHFQLEFNVLLRQWLFLTKSFILGTSYDCLLDLACSKIPRYGIQFRKFYYLFIHFQLNRRIISSRLCWYRLPIYTSETHIAIILHRLFHSRDDVICSNSWALRYYRKRQRFFVFRKSEINTTPAYKIFAIGQLARFTFFSGNSWL